MFLSMQNRKMTRAGQDLNPRNENAKKNLEAARRNLRLHNINGKNSFSPVSVFCALHFRGKVEAILQMRMSQKSRIQRSPRQRAKGSSLLQA